MVQSESRPFLDDLRSHTFRRGPARTEIPVIPGYAACYGVVTSLPADSITAGRNSSENSNRGRSITRSNSNVKSMRMDESRQTPKL